jgi:hypothetical protein
MFTDRQQNKVVSDWVYFQAGRPVGKGSQATQWRYHTILVASSKGRLTERLC